VATTSVPAGQCPNKTPIFITGGPGLSLHLKPICKPDEPFNCRGSPSSFNPIFPGEYCNPVFGFEIVCWPHHVYLHIKYGVWLLKPRQYAAMTLIGKTCFPDYRGGTRLPSSHLVPLVLVEGRKRVLPHHWWEWCASLPQSLSMRALTYV
jgi:hypothetical protein